MVPLKMPKKTKKSREKNKEKTTKTQYVQCPICGQTFETLDKLVDHFRDQSYRDKNYEMLLTAYYTIIAHIGRAISRLFGEFYRSLREIERDIKSLKKPDEKQILGIIQKIENALDQIPEPEDPIEDAVYESVVSYIKSVLGWRHKTKKDLLRILSAIRTVFTEGKKPYITILVKSAMILSNKYFVNV